jgi:uncharacterized protein (TIGR00369 family)
MPAPKMPPPCFEFLHSELIEIESGRAVVRFSPIEQMENPFGQIQGGILAGMIDNCVGPAVGATTPDRQTTTIQMSIHFLKPVIAGETIIGTAEVVKYGRTQAYVEANLTRESDGELLVKATATNLFLGKVDPVRHAFPED